MTSNELAASYFKKVADHLEILEILHRKGAWSNVIREAQEIVELALKGALRSAGVDPPKWHDVGTILEDHRERLPDRIRGELDRIVAISLWLRKERELAFYGEIDFIPTENYTEAESRRAMDDATFVVGIVTGSK